MKYYKYLDLHNEKICSEKIKNYLGKDIPDNFWTNMDKNELFTEIPEIQTLFSPMQLTINKISILTQWYVTPGMIHKDSGETKVRINLPILNCEGSVTNFYESTEDPFYTELPNEIPYYRYDPIYCKLVDSFCLNRPAAIRVGSPHQIHVISEIVPRISCTFEFNEDISYLLE